ncbi:MAG: F0F1 ATP synthase subunit delta [Micrococcaceae bacterium]
MSSSSDSLASLEKELKPVYSTAGVKVSQELSAAIGVISRSSSLQRALTDVSYSPEQRAELLQKLFDSKVSKPTEDILTAAVKMRWNSGLDLVQGLEKISQLCVIYEAQSQGKLEDLESEMLTFNNALEDYPELEQAFENYSVDNDDKKALVSKLTSNYSEQARALIQPAVVYPHGLRATVSLQRVIHSIAEEKHEFIAVVDTAIALTSQQEETLKTKLSKMYGRPITLNIREVPDLVGGIRVRVGNDVMDGTVKSRVETLQQQLAGHQ